MSKAPISFRLTEQELEILASARQPNESLNQVAARLLREKLGVINNSDESSSTKTSLEVWISDNIRYQIERIKQELESKIEDETVKLDRKLGTLETRLSENIEIWQKVNAANERSPKKTRSSTSRKTSL